MTLLVDKNILWFKIAVYNARLVEVVECKRHFCSVETCSLLIETTLLLLQMEEKLSSIYELHDHIKAFLVLECKLETHDERMVKFFENLTFHYTP